MALEHTRTRARQRWQQRERRREQQAELQQLADELAANPNLRVRRKTNPVLNYSRAVPYRTR